MPTYTRETLLEVSADSAYAYLSDVGNLPKYFPRVTQAHVTGPDEVSTTAVIDPPDHEERTVEGTASFHADPPTKHIRWGSEGDSDYRGELELTEDGDGASTLRLTLHTEHDHPGVDGSIDETLTTIRSQIG